MLKISLIYNDSLFLKRSSRTTIFFWGKNTTKREIIKFLKNIYSINMLQSICRDVVYRQYAKAFEWLVRRKINLGHRFKFNGETQA